MSRRAATLLSTVLACVNAPRGVASDVQPVRSPSFDLAYAVSEAALPLTEVELWFTQDDGATWHLFGKDEDRHSPMRFRAPAEGLFGFFVVLRNSTGPSSAPPAPGDAPHQRAFVDYTSPVVQFHLPRATSSLGERVVQIRWTAVDAQFPARPVQLEFRAAGKDEWSSATSEPLSNTGRFDWRIPENLVGSIPMRVVVTDRGGNRAVSEPQAVQLDPPASAYPAPAPPAPAPQIDPEVELTLPGSQRAQERIAALLDAASRSAEHGDTAQAIAKLREVVRLDPRRTEAFVSLGGFLQQSGDHDRALHAYEIALQQEPQRRDALVGSALVLREKREYESAAGRLRTVLRYTPDDAEAWMILGDVAVFQGNELLARDCYRRATRIDPNATQVIADAQQRLAIMAGTAGQAVSK